MSVTETMTEGIHSLSNRASEAIVRHELDRAGITVGGDEPHDIEVHDPDFYSQVLAHGILGLGESYTHGKWDAQHVDQFIAHGAEHGLQRLLIPNIDTIRAVTAGALFNRQNRRRAPGNIVHHYNDVGTDLYERMLDPRMQYTCAYYGEDAQGERATNLAEAQEAKLDLICRKLKLEPGMTVLEMGCGWGGFAKYAAEKYGVEVTGITLAPEQAAIARERTADLPVTIVHGDARDATGSYERVVTIGMLEHFGPKNYQSFFKQCQRLLKDDGLMLHHFISGNRSTNSTNPWFDKYIFPGGVIPTLKLIAGAAEGKFVIEDVQNIGPDYDPTLMAWDANFTESYPDLPHDKYDETFKRTWQFYLLSSAGMFRTRNLNLHHVVMSKIRSSARYEGVR